MSAVLTQVPEEDGPILKRVRKLHQWYEELNLRVDKLSGVIADIGQPLEVRGPDPDAEEQRYTQAEVRFLMGAAAQEGRRNYGGNHKSGGPNINTIMLTVLTVVIIPTGAWIVSALIDHGQQLAQIRCQLNPSSCLQLQAPHVP